MTILVQQQLREATERLIAEGENCWPATVERFTELANPAAVLALLDEIDRLTRAAKYCEDIDATHENHRETMLYDMAVERDQLKTENSELRRDAERYRWIAGNVSDDAVGRGSEWHRDWRRAWRLPLLLSNSAVAEQFTFEEAVDQAMTKEQP